MLDKIKIYRNRILGSEFIQNVFYLTGTSAFAQVIPFLALPFLQKYFYSPSEFGVFTAYVVLSELIISVSTLKFEYAIVGESRTKNTVNLLFLSIIVAFIIALLTFLIISVLKYIGYEATIFLSLGNLVYLIPLSVLAYGIFESVNYWFNRNKKFYFIGTSKAVLSLGSESSKLLFGINNFSGGLVAGRVTGQITGMIMNVFFLMKSHSRLLRLFSLSQMKALIIKHKNLPIFTASGVLVGALINYVYISMFLNYYGQETIGIMGVSVSYVAAAFSMISVSFAQVFYRKISDIDDIRYLKKLYLRYGLLLTGLSSIVIAVIYLVPSPVINMLLGEKWIGMMPVMRTMVLWLALSFVTSSLSFVYIKLNRQKEMFLMDLLHLFLIVTTVYIAHRWAGEFIITLRFFTGAQILYYVSAFVVALIFLNNSQNSKKQ